KDRGDGVGSAGRGTAAGRGAARRLSGDRAGRRLVAAVAVRIAGGFGPAVGRAVGVAQPGTVDLSGTGRGQRRYRRVRPAGRYLLDSAPAPVRDFVMGNLHQSTPCGTDRYNQTFGIPSAFTRPWAAKQGWHGFGDIPANPCTAGAVASPRPVTADVGILDGAV